MYSMGVFDLWAVQELLLYFLQFPPWLMPWPSFIPPSSLPLLLQLTSITLLRMQRCTSPRVWYLSQVFLKALVRSPEQSAYAETVGVFLVADPRLLQKRVQFLSDVRLHLVMTVALCEGGGGLLWQRRRQRGKEAGDTMRSFQLRRWWRVMPSWDSRIRTETKPNLLQSRSTSVRPSVLTEP